MADDYIVKCILTHDGKDIEDFESITEHPIKRAKPVELMNKTGFGKLTPRYTFSVVYVVPTTNPLDWSKVTNDTFVIKDDGGRITTYIGVRLIEEGEAKRDGKEEVKQTIELGATKRNPA
jgi:hypothetical protein